ncbi:MAG: membrane protein insertion efficiency factor YidD [Pseudomonadota bacterium]
MSRFLLIAIRAYQITLSPWIGRQCRFYPTCSDYSREAIIQHGPWKGAWLTVRRLSKCHPFNPGGVDFVPDYASKNSSSTCSAARPAPIDN